MPVRHVIDPALNVLLVLVDGELTDADLSRFLRELPNEKGYRPDMPELIDLSDVTRVSVSGAGLHEAAHSRVHAPTSMRAILATMDAVFGWARMYQIYREIAGDQHLRVCHTWEEAAMWLGIPASSLTDLRDRAGYVSVRPALRGAEGAA